MKRLMKRPLVSCLGTLAVLVAFCGNATAGTFASITIDGDTSDWAGVPMLASDPADALAGAVADFADVWIANDDDYLYVRFTLHAAGAPFSGPNNYFFGTDADPSTGLPFFGVGSEMDINGSAAIDQRMGGFFEGDATVDFLSAGAVGDMDFEFRVSRTGTYDNDSAPVFTQDDILVLLESETSSFDFADIVHDPAGNDFITYTFAAVPEPGSLALAFVASCGMLVRRKSK